MNIQELKNKMESWSISTKSKNFSFILTVFIWLVIFISFVVIKPTQKEPKYKEIQIVLDSVKKIEKKENLTTEKKDTLAKNQKENQQVAKTEPKENKENIEQKVETPVPPVEKQKVEPKKEVQNKIVEKIPEKKVAEKQKEVKKPAAKPVEKKVESKPAEMPAPIKEVSKTEPVKYAKSVEDLMEEQFEDKKSVEDFDWDSMFEDDSDSDSNTSSETKKITTKNTTTGTAGSVSESQNAVVSSTTKSNNTSQKVSESTSGKLSQISNAEFVGKSNISEKTSVGSNGKVSVKMQNGQSRVLLSPSEPKIYISEEGAKLIEGSVTVVINFTVLESGTVPSGEISITPASLLPSTVRNEIVSQLSKWRFEADDFAALARLEFSIVKK